MRPASIARPRHAYGAVSEVRGQDSFDESTLLPFNYSRGVIYLYYLNAKFAFFYSINNRFVCF